MTELNPHKGLRFIETPRGMTLYNPEKPKEYITLLWNNPNSGRKSGYRVK